ncbi:hypothetical protein L2091_07850 [Curtobacterium albidum]|uniref:hypothetical protein n=1 Tax=Curtobacterium citreum TaxID=2036 RepID=UPI0020260A66|nr:hypothetical protein [Curtobacterium albidum]MCL9665141.1 hypothetical protein [Curtobacterium albidum]
MSLELRFRYDGALLLELMRDGYDAIDSTVVQVDDEDRIRAVLRWWIASAPPTARRRGELPARKEFGSAPAYAIRVTKERSVDAAKLTRGSDAASRGFEQCLAHGQVDPTSPAAESFIGAVAQGAPRLFRSEQLRAEKRLADGSYTDVLRSYLEEMQGFVDASDQHDAYHGVRAGIGSILDDERYLTLSPRGEVRALYAALLTEQSNLYQWYMDLAKGGNQWSRGAR